MNLLQIQTFLEVAKAGSFSKASQCLSVPRSTVSARVRALEERLNFRLLQRTTRSVSLTNEGQRYYELSDKAIALLSEAEAEFSHPDSLSGNIRLSAPIDISKNHLANILTQFTDLHPLVHVEIIIADEIIDMVENNIDLALRGQSPGNLGLVARRLGEGQMGLYASPQYARSNLKRGSLKDFSGHVVFDPTGLGANIFGLATVKTPIETRNFELVKALATNSKGLALLPETICKDALLKKELVLLKSNQKLPVLAMFIVMPSRKLVPLRVRALVDFLVSTNAKKAVL